MTKFSKGLTLCCVFCVSLLGGCASNQAEERQAAASNEYQGDPKDPLEPINRVAWDFNWDVLDAYILRPVTVGYVTVMPKFARTGLQNAADNLEEPGNFFNNLLQGKVDNGLDSLFRFILNSTVGLLGTIDVASHIGIERHRENFGEVLGYWGVDTGPYLMIPALGPNDPRSLSGDVVDNMYYPMTIVTGNINVLRFAVSALEGRAALLDQEGQIEQAVDPYAFVKNAYFQNLEYRVTDGKSGERGLQQEQLDDFEDFESMLNDMEAAPADNEQNEEPK